jgi:hypothetical protein
MQKIDAVIIEQLAKSAVVGAFSGMAVVGGVLWFDLSSIGSLFNGAQNQLLANFFLAGAMLKGAVLGAAIGSARLSARHAVAARTSPVARSAQVARA